MKEGKSVEVPIKPDWRSDPNEVPSTSPASSPWVKPERPSIIKQPAWISQPENPGVQQTPKRKKVPVGQPNTEPKEPLRRRRELPFPRD